MTRTDDFMHIMELSNSKKITILTNHYQITGQVRNCEECTKDFFINLTDVSICLINDVYEVPACDKYTSLHYNWLHVNIDKILAFSFKP